MSKWVKWHIPIGLQSELFKDENARFSCKKKVNFAKNFLGKGVKFYKQKQVWLPKIL